MTRQPAPVQPPVVLTVAGSDSGGGAGIQADLKAIEAGGAFGTSAVTSVTAQHTRGVERTHVLPVEEVAAQMEAVLEDFDVAAVKTGMLATADVLEAVADYAPDLPNLVVDPVMVAASGDRLLDRDAEAAYGDLVAAATLVTPNADEAEVLTGVEVTDADAAREAGDALVEAGADAALVTGGHVPGDEVVDVLVAGAGNGALPDDGPGAGGDGPLVRTFSHDRVDTETTHGSGCTLSAAVATRLAHGDDLATAVGEGIALLSSAVRYGVDVGRGPGSVHHLVEARNEAARRETAAAVESVVADLVARDPVAVLPPDGTNVAGATPYAETPGDVAGVEGGLGRTRRGLRANRGVAFGAADRLARLVLAVRERDPTVRFAASVRRDDAVRGALEGLSGAVATLPGSGGADEADETDGPVPRTERVARALDGVDESPVAVVGTGERGGRVAVVAPTAPGLTDRLATLAATVGE